MVSISPCQSSHHLPRTPKRGWCISLCSIITWFYIWYFSSPVFIFFGITFRFGGDDRWYLDSTVWGICRLYLLIVVLIAHLAIVQLFVLVSLWEDFLGYSWSPVRWKRMYCLRWLQGWIRAREIARNSTVLTQKSHPKLNPLKEKKKEYFHYLPDTAAAKAIRRRRVNWRVPLKRLEILSYTIDHLWQGWSPNIPLYRSNIFPVVFMLVDIDPEVIRTTIYCCSKSQVREI